MAQKTISNGMAGSVVRGNINDNFTELYNNKANKNHSSADTSYGVASTSQFGHVKVATDNPINVSGGVLSVAVANSEQVAQGIANDVVMTPAKTKEAIGAFGIQSDGNIIIKVGGAQPTPQAGKTIIWIDMNS